MLFDYIQQKNINHNICGKLIVATNSSQLSLLHQLKLKGEVNGVKDLQLLSGDRVKNEYENEVVCLEALYSPKTGIIDSHNLMEHFAQDISDFDSNIVLNCNAEKIEVSSIIPNYQFDIYTNQGKIKSKYLINAGGLSSVFIAKSISEYPTNLIPNAFYAKGNYFKVSNNKIFKHLVYPLPEVGGLGIHATIDLNGDVKFGPDVEWLKENEDENNTTKANDNYEFVFGPPTNYTVDSDRSHKFYGDIRKYWPNLPDNSLIPDYSGIRPKVSGPLEKYHDFIIQGPRHHSIPGLVNLFGIESPGLTSCMAIGEYVNYIIRD